MLPEYPKGFKEVALWWVKALFGLGTALIVVEGLLAGGRELYREWGIWPTLLYIYGILWFIYQYQKEQDEKAAQKAKDLFRDLPPKP